MHLVSCDTPQGSLEDAPRTALFAEPSAGEQWDGFWSPQTDGYYARHTRIDGRVEWFELADEDVAATDEAASLPASATIAQNVLTGSAESRRGRARAAVFVASSPDGRRMLVGSARRSSKQ